MDSSFQVKDNRFSAFNDHEFSWFDSFVPGHMGICGNSQGGVKELDGEKGGLVKEPAVLVKKKTSEMRNEAALKNHCEAERRRRERINGHFAALRNFVPCTDKMDKASVLAEVISQIKELRKQATEAANGLLIPTVADQLTVEPFTDLEQEGIFGFRATLCCEHKRDLISDVKQAIDTLELTVMKAEISTLGNRVKSVLIITGSKEAEINIDVDRKRVARCIHQALSSVMDKVYALDEYSLRTMFFNKRPRVSFCDNKDLSLF